MYIFFFIGDKLFIRMGTKLLPYNESFRIFVLTKIKNTHYFSKILAQTTMIDFTIQEEGLEELLLTSMINVENPGLEELENNTVINIEKDKKSIVELQDELLTLLVESECSLMENEQLLYRLKSSKTTFTIIKEQIEHSLASRAEILVAREV